MMKSWTTGLDKDLTLEIKQHFASSLVLRKRLIEMLRDKEREASKDARSKLGYDCPNWAYKQADTSGYTRALHDVISLIEN